MLKTYFTFSKNQTRAVITLLVLIFLCVLANFLLPYFLFSKLEKPNDDLQKMMAQIELDETNNQSKYEHYNNKEYVPHKLTPFRFDPNTLDSSGFVKLGLSEKLAHTITNYRNKGGKFYNAESLKRIYGLHEDEFTQLAPYISIANSNNFNHFDQKKKEILHIELNNTDTAELIKLRGIGSKLSMNIIKYRAQLGGFANVNQLKEVYGISPETFEQIKTQVFVNIKLIKKLNLNEATLNELNQHPYLRGDIAKSIVDFRKQKNYHIENIAQLKEIELLNEELFRKIAPYISVQ